MLINVLNQEGIDLEAYCSTSGEIKALSNTDEVNLKSSTEVENNNVDT